MIVRRLVAAAALLLVVATRASAHESRPACLQITETRAGQYDLVWKRPAQGEAVLSLTPILPDGCHDLVPVSRVWTPDALVERRTVVAAGGLVGGTITIDGLSATLTDVLVRIEFLDGRVQTNLLKPAAPSVVVQGVRPAVDVAADYLRLGVEHILFGVDHLLFVLGLLLIASGVASLVRTITAFTLAHSITLALAALGVVRVPQAPVEAAIALSIVFLACEIVRGLQGRPGLASRRPWLVAFAFGLLHGLGFAGALAEVGLPQTDIPLSLLSFNVGVELGQLLFVAAVLAVLWSARRAATRLGVAAAARPAWAAAAPAYGIGSVAAFWFIQRVADFGGA